MSIIPNTIAAKLQSEYNKATRNAEQLRNSQPLTAAKMQDVFAELRRADRLYTLMEDVKETLSLDIARQEQTTPLDLRDVPTVKLLSIVARHLSGRDVRVSVEDIPSQTVIGETWHDGNSIRINIDPTATTDATKYMRVFLHEVAHAKKHVTNNRVMPVSEDVENEAVRLSRYWQGYALQHKRTGMHAAGINESANDFRLQLIALLDTE